MTQFDIDCNSRHAKNFKIIRNILLSFDEIREVKNANQTSYKDRLGVVIMMRTKGEHLVLAFGKGYLLQEKFPQLKGSGKVVRHLYFRENDTIDTELIKAMIEESLILNIEQYELKS